MVLPAIFVVPSTACLALVYVTSCTHLYMPKGNLSNHLPPRKNTIMSRSPSYDVLNAEISTNQPRDHVDGVSPAEDPPLDELTPLRAPSAANIPSPFPLRRTLTFINGLAIVTDIQIGSGIFTSPSAVLRDIASPVAVLLVWVVAGALAWAGANCFIELGSRIPRNGGIQEYLRYIYGDTCACIATWTLIFIVKPCSIAMMCLVFAEYLLNLSTLSTTANVWLLKSLALGTLALVTLANSIGTRVSARIANVFFALKLLGLGSTIVMGLTFGLFINKGMNTSLGDRLAKYRLYSQAQEDGHPIASTNLWATMGTYTDAILAAMWAYSGWEAV